MSDTTVQDCVCCEIETDCIKDLCERCSDYNYMLQKQSDIKPDKSISIFIILRQ